MADVVISYKSQRRFAAEHMADILTGHGFSVWYDYSLMSGRDFGRQIETELNAAQAVVVLWCSLARESEWVRQEATIAKRLDKIVPAKIAEIELPLGFTLVQTLDLTGWDGSPRSQSVHRLLTDIGRLVGRPAQPQQDGLDLMERVWRRSGAPALLTFQQIEPLGQKVQRTLPGGTDPIKAPVVVPASTTSGSTAAWTLIQDSLDAVEYSDFETLHPGAAGVIVARRHRRQREAWARIDQTDPQAITAFLRTPPFAALMNEAERPADIARQRNGSTRREREPRGRSRPGR